MDLFTIKKCFDCPNRVADLDNLAGKLQRALADCRFNERQGARVNAERPLHHQMFHIALAGCPNSCSQPQIKDFGVQGQAVPEAGEGCNNCGACAGACPEAAVTPAKGKPVVNRDTCLNCGLCARACPAGAIRIEKSGFKVMVGGKLGRHPRLATELIPLASEDEVAACLARCLEIFLTEGRPGERFGSIIERINL